MELLFKVAIGLSVKEDWDTYERKVPVLLDRAFVGLKKFKPTREKDCLLIRASDYKVGLSIRDWLNKKDMSYYLHEESKWDIAALVHARYVLLWVMTGGKEDVDLDRDGQPLNRSPNVLCNKCGWVDPTVVACKYKVWAPAVQGRREIFYASDGKFIINARVLDLLQGVVKNQIVYGPVRLVGGRTKKTDSKLFWFRPKYTTGPSVTIVWDEKCKACNRPLKCWSNETYGIGGRLVVNGFGGAKHDIATVGSWVGDRRDPRGNDDLLRRVVVSGGLFAYLYNCRIKGLLLPEGGGVYSEKGESPIEPIRRFSHLKTGKEDIIVRMNFELP
jgi:hypothetical protein